MVYPIIWDFLLIAATVEASDFKFGTEHEFGFTLLEQLFDRKEVGSVWIRGHSSNLGTYTSAAIKANNFKLDRLLDLGKILSKQQLRHKLAMS